MKIVQLIYSLQQGGAERFVVSLSNELVRQGCEVVVLCLLPLEGTYLFNSQFLDKRVKLLSANKSVGFSLAKIIRVEEIIGKIHPDVIHCHLNVIPYIFLSAFKKKYRIVHTLHSLAQFASGLRVQKSINRFFYKTKRIIPIAISKECNKSFVEYYHLHLTAEIDNGVASPKSSNTFTDVKEWISKHKPTSSTKVFIHVARFFPQKNQLLLIDSFNMLANEGLDFMLIIIGNGFGKPEASELRKKACARIYFLGLKSNVSDYLFLSDFFCLTSLYEGLPLSLLEALSCGVTPVCTPAGGIRDVVSDGRTGYLSTDFTTASYVDAVRRAISHPFAKDFLKVFFEKNYSMKQCASKYIDVYSHL